MCKKDHKSLKRRGLTVEATGFVRNLDRVGKVTVPKGIRKNLDIIEDESVLEISVGDEQELILRKYEPGCIFCGEADGAITFKGKLVCMGCANGIARQEKDKCK